jgi:hypothetical protein
MPRFLPFSTIGATPAAFSFGLVELEFGHPLLVTEEQASMVVEDGHRLPSLLPSVQHAGHLFHGDGVDVKQRLDGDRSSDR